MPLWSKLKRIFTTERLLWCGLTLLMSAVFLVIGLTAPALKGFERKENTEIIHQEESLSEATSSFVSEVGSDEDTSGKVPINTATKEQLMSINGIGESFAQRIIDYREQNGGFTSLEQLKDIDGIGEKRYEKWRAYFTLD